METLAQSSTSGKKRKEMRTSPSGHVPTEGCGVGTALGMALDGSELGDGVGGVEGAGSGGELGCAEGAAEGDEEGSGLGGVEGAAEGGELGRELGAGDGNL